MSGLTALQALRDTGGLLIRAPLLSLVVQQRIRVGSDHPNQRDLLVLRELPESGKLIPIALIKWLIAIR